MLSHEINHEMYYTWTKDKKKKKQDKKSENCRFSQLIQQNHIFPTLHNHKTYAHNNYENIHVPVHRVTEWNLLCKSHNSLQLM